MGDICKIWIKETIGKENNRESFKISLGKLFVLLVMERMDMEYYTVPVMLDTDLDTIIHIIPF